MTVGTDIIEIERVRRAAARRPAFWNRVLTPEEERYCRSKGDGAASLAGRFAAKEAVMKALGVGLGDISFRDIEIMNDAAGAPFLCLTAKTADKMESAGLDRIVLSISHSRDYAVAVAIGEERK
ncbi:MAG: holo-ACP synthase [Peptococcaceae bacterium]|jgi:holo-[acyl-carrier protein] synthase|nr:holo-ACP synthase [Peptococcaceae bacterium]